MSANGNTTSLRLLAGACGAAALVAASLGPAPAVRAAAPGGGGETIECEAGQTANTDLGTCVDPVCGIGTERDPTGQTRYCVTIPCPRGQYLLPYSNTCISWPPPPPRCPGGSIGVPHRLPNGITLIICPRRLPTGQTPPSTHSPATNSTTSRAP
jgi:hypothetical protein